MGFYGEHIGGGKQYIFVEQCPNGTLTDYIRKGIPEARVLVLFRQLLEGMCYMNAKGRRNSR